jgi:hypothetical protein
MTVSYCLRLETPRPGGPGPRIHVSQRQGGPVITPGTQFPFRCLLQLAGLRWKLCKSLNLYFIYTIIQIESLSHREHSVSITKEIWLILFREMIAIYSETRRNPTDTFSVSADVTNSNHYDFNAEHSWQGLMLCKSEWCKWAFLWRAPLIHLVRLAEVQLVSRPRRQNGINTLFDVSEIWHSTVIETLIDFSEEIQSWRKR